MSPRCQNISVFFFHGPTAPSGSGPSDYRDFMITVGHTALGRTLLGEYLARRIDLYLATRCTNKRRISTPPEGFEPAIPASGRPQAQALDRAATGVGGISVY